METNLEADFKELRQVFNSGKTKESSWRISQLHGLLHILEDREDDISMALKQDLGKHHVEAYRDEIGTVVKSVNYALKNLNQWMAGKKASLPLAAFPSTAELLPEPLGVVLIISSWNFPFGLSLEPMIGAIAAGNAIVLKPSELAPSCSSFLAETIRDYLDNSAIKVIEGGSATGERLLEHKFDKIFFTAAAQHLTPVTLELGGKCPAVVDSLSVSGDANVELLKKYVTQFYGDGPKGSHSMSNIINKKHFSRLKSLLDEPRVKSSIVHGGLLDEESLFIWPTILVDPPLDAAIMTEEIFGPLLPVITLERIEESIEFIRARPKPLALYAFTKNGNFQKGLISETSSGSVMFNDVILQYAVDTLPFGGVGESGFGRYHGKYSFENFSHEKVVLTRSFFIDFWFRYPPWDDKKLQLIKSGLRFDYLGFLLIALGLKSKA
ncbi:Aldehyde dehydrogenase, C-terminal [Cynara cardunculus var. scolymus]|uniref:Aldehyde dehydrogenase n=1 Tax=Cynara cardunculus var. scolymus TaxID=59895 RepID=A0A103XHG6_CYNCS|nr:Aldehyde dehydrogenase, C-terminal [Cynara cardunculus var. scolymus]